jgi:ATP dependent DNA ligase domain
MPEANRIRVILWTNVTAATAVRTMTTRAPISTTKFTFGPFGIPESFLPAARDIEGLAQLRPQGNAGPPRRLPERKAILHKVLQRTRRGIQYVEHTEGDGVEMFKAICKLGLEGIVSKKRDAPYKSGPSKAWLKIKNPNAPAATRAADGTF